MKPELAMLIFNTANDLGYVQRARLSRVPCIAIHDHELDFLKTSFDHFQNKLEYDDITIIVSEILNKLKDNDILAEYALTVNGELKSSICDLISDYTKFSLLLNVKAGGVMSYEIKHPSEERHREVYIKFVESMIKESLEDKKDDFMNNLIDIIFNGEDKIRKVIDSSRLFQLTLHPEIRRELVKRIAEKEEYDKNQLTLF